MANVDEEVRTAIVLGLHKFLLQVHQELLEGCKGTHRPLPETLNGSGDPLRIRLSPN